MRFHQLGKIGLAAIVFMIVAAGPASASPPCTAATFSGVYGLMSQGTDNSGPKAGVHQFTADGAGKITAGSGTESHNGVIKTVTFTGTYTLAKNCTGTVTLISSGGTLHYNMTIDNAKKGFLFMRSDSGQVESGFGVAEGTAICTTSGISSAYAETLSGNVFAGSSLVPVANVGETTSNGSGRLSGTDVVDVNGVITTRNLAGSYTVNSNCTGTETITVLGTKYKFALIIVNGGSELLLLDTDANTIVSGTMQK